MKLCSRKMSMSSWASLFFALLLLTGLCRTSLADTPSGKSPSMVRLDANAAQLNSDMVALHTRLQAIHKALWLTKSLLAIPGNLAADLRKLEAELKMLNSLLNTAEAIPELREDAKKAKQQVSVALQEVSTARARAEQTATTVEPYRTRISDADTKIQKLDTNAERFRIALINPISTVTGVAQTCVNQAASANKSCMQNAVDHKGDQLDSAILLLDKVVKLAITDVPDPAFLKKLDADFQSLDALRNKVDQVIKSARSLTAAMKELESLIGRRFAASFPYPNPTWKNPIRISHYEIHVSMKTILNGSKAIEGEIEHVLSKSLWKAAKIFGVGKLVDSLKHQAEKELSGIRKALHVDGKLTIPELARIDSLFDNISAELSHFPVDFGIHLPDISLDAPSLNFQGNVIDLSALKKLMNEMTPHGISGPSVSLCQDVSYGCHAATQTQSKAPTSASPTPTTHGQTVMPPHPAQRGHGMTPPPRPPHIGPHPIEWPVHR